MGCMKEQHKAGFKIFHREIVFSKSEKQWYNRDPDLSQLENKNLTGQENEEKENCFKKCSNKLSQTMSNRIDSLPYKHLWPFCIIAFGCLVLFVYFLTLS